MILRRTFPLLLLLLGAGLWMQAAAQTRSLDALKKQANTGSAKAELALGKRLMQSKEEADTASAVTWFRKAATQGNSDAEWQLGLAYVSGHGVAREMSTGLQWMRKSVLAHRSPKHMMFYGYLMIMQGESTHIRQDTQEGIKWLSRAAHAGSTDAMQVLGGLQLVGQLGVTQNTAAGKRWLVKAARGGNTKAEAFLGKAYIYGLGLHADAGKGLHWLRKAAHDGNVSAQGALGYLLVTGKKSVPKDPSKGIDWATKAAAQDNAQAYYALGLAYQHGTGEPTDPAKAWYNFAAAKRLTKNQKSRQHADQHMAAVAGKLSAAQLDKLRARVATIPVPKKEN